jgi:L,D-transpeptidase YcbB
MLVPVRRVPTNRLSALGGILCAGALFLFFPASGCGKQQAADTPPQTTIHAPAPDSGNISDRPAPSPAVAARLRDVAAAGKLDSLDSPDFSDYRLHVQHIYEGANYMPLWLVGTAPTPQALAVIQALEASEQKGLNPADYDAARWPDRLSALKAGASNAAQADFDLALTVGIMRYISDLHIGRVNPTHFKFGIDIETKKYDLPLFVRQQVINAPNVQAALDTIEPHYDVYRRTEAAFQHYLQLEAKGDGPLVPEPAKTVAPGDPYPAASQLTQRLRLLGDLPESTSAAPDSQTYDATLVEGVKHFQGRHGISPDGKLGKDTVRQLNVPLAARVRRLQDALERWRWLPPQFPQPPVIVNVPEFVLRAFTADHQVALMMNVVVGKALRTETPVFAKDMRYIVFRPYWNIPPSILRAEVIPGIVKDRSYLTRKRMEITDNSGKVITDGAVSDAVLAQLRAGKLMARQKPGPDNSLGLVKFIFPNENNVYLHSTPAQQLFAQSRRDFSHGCVRVEKPADLATFLLRNQPPWTADRVKTAMQTGPDNQQVNLTTPVPVLIFYVTAVVVEDGSVHFFDDIYGHDKSLDVVLAKGPPYPG